MNLKFLLYVDKNFHLPVDDAQLLLQFHNNHKEVIAVPPCKSRTPCDLL